MKQIIKEALFACGVGSAILLSFLFFGLRAKAEDVFYPELVTIDRSELADMRERERWYEDPPYTEDEYYLLAALIWAEAGDQDFTGKRLVADVVLNRVASPAWPDTIASVIFQEGQFAVVPNGRLNEGFSRADSDCYAAASLALDGDRVNTEVMFFSMYYCANGAFAFQHGDHYFGY